jgi:threonine/homoserine/homoserine lactone efflux protein
MSGTVFLSSLWIGLSIAAPVGPIGLLVVQRTLQQGRALGLATGLGAAVADAAYGAVGAFGVVALVAALQALRVPLALGGGAFMLWLAWRTWRDAGADADRRGAGCGDDNVNRNSNVDGNGNGNGRLSSAAQGRGTPALASAFLGTFLLTLANPATVLSFIAIFGVLAAAGGGAAASASPGSMVLGVLAGSALWWLLLCAAVGALRGRFDARARRWVGRASALGLGGFALWQWARLAYLSLGGA